MSTRIPQLDFLKGILILHVIMIHLVYLGQCHPDFKQFILLYTTPAFFIISGFLAHVNKPTKAFIKKVIWWAIPYFIMEGAYIIMASVLPIKEHINHLTTFSFFQHLILEPLGPYWYIHDLIVCYLVYFILNKLLAGKFMPLLPILGILCILALSYTLNLVLLQSCIFFAFGIVIKRSKMDFLKFFQPTWGSLPFILLLFFFHHKMPINTYTKSAVLAYLIINFFCYIYPYLPHKIHSWINTIGRNTLAILLFSPIFTILTKLFVPFFTFEPTAILFTVVSVSFCTAGCFAVTYLMDKTKISPYFCGQEHFLKI